MRSIRDVGNIKVRRHNLKCKRYVDGTALIDDSKDKLRLLIELLVEVGKQKGLKLNASETKIIVISKSTENVRVMLFFLYCCDIFPNAKYDL